MEDVYIYAIPLPGAVKGVTIRRNGDYVIFVSSNLCEKKQDETLAHELQHLECDHMYDCRDVCFLEHEARTKTKNGGNTSWVYSMDGC